MRHLRPSLVLIALVSLLPAAVPAADDLAGVYATLDKSALSFRGLSADVKRIKHTAVVPEEDEQIGKILVRRAKPHELQMRADFDTPKYEAVLDGTKVEIYYPKSNTIQPYLIGKTSRPMAEQLLLLGWGSGSQDLKSTFNIAFDGLETAAGQKTAKLVLIPKDPDLLTNVPKLELWICQEGVLAGTAVQVKFYEKGLKDYSVATYTNIKLRSVPESEVRLTAPKNAVREKPVKF